MTKKPLIVLTGPTAVGKTKLSIDLAKAVNGEIISADSMQVYKYMDIGSAKIMPGEMQGVPHHLVDVLMPEEEFHVARFQAMAKEAMQGIYERGRVPILVGGTGFYIQAVVRDIDFTETDTDMQYRRELEDYAKDHSPQALHEKLREVDPAAADEIHANNVKRTVRALEFFYQTGTRISEHNQEQKEKESPYGTRYFVLNDIRSRLYERIDRRVDQMLDMGLVEEVRMLQRRGLTKEMVSMQGLGYKEILDYLDGRCSLEEAVYTLKRDTRHFAKRQLTWFRREKDVIWVNKNEFDYDDEKILEYMLGKYYE
ncbi:MAG: tRNA (adenosine(37)-N6)-dimethylallyltransferase MiaA [Lachnospiraceae bacterium]|nr:tRNA (adenosine(37)-N6)-dimethylallyltransferase MiaA [Lachnospiraceae bacterium]